MTLERVFYGSFSHVTVCSLVTSASRYIVTEWHWENSKYHLPWVLNYPLESQDSISPASVLSACDKVAMGIRLTGREMIQERQNGGKAADFIH